MSIDEKFKNFVQRKSTFKVSPLKDHFIKQLTKINEKSAELYGTKSPVFPLRPSNALACGRKLFYELENFFNPEANQPEPINIRQSRVFRWGHIIEEFEINGVNAVRGLQVTHQQFKVHIGNIHGFAVIGSIDGIIWKLKDKTPYLTDVKSINTFGFRDVQKAVLPKMSNYAQLNLYLCSPGYNELMDSLGVPKDKRKGLLFYSNKDNQEFEWIEFDPDPEIAKATLERFEKVYVSYRKGELPPRDYVETKRFPCAGYCPHSMKCMGGGAGYADEDKRIPVTFDLNLDADEKDIIFTLWQKCGTSSTYLYQDKLLRVIRGETKWSLKVEAVVEGKEVAVEADGNKKGRKTGKKKAAKKAKQS